MKFNYLILSWFDNNKRDLPWRNTRNPFHIWLSEIILQQTRVDQGMNFYINFITEFDTIYDLAQADEQKVLKLWQGLGYYSRARNLHFTSKFIANELNGVFPNTFLELKKLKGVGDYTAAAIASIVYNEPVPAVDGNMFRVFSRYFNIEDDISNTKAKKIFWELGLEIIDKKRPGDFNQAVMDLGATICTPKAPKCEICPLNDSCEALRLNKVLALPVKTKKVKVKDRFLNFVYMEKEGKIALTKRTTSDVWQNLYTLPMFETMNSDDNLVNIDDLNLEILVEEKHILSHQNLYIKFFRLRNGLEQNIYEANLLQSSDIEWVEYDKIINYPFPKPIEKFIKSIFLT